MITSIQGSLHTHTGTSLTLIALLFSLAGIPPMVGFFAKLEVFYVLVYSIGYLLSFVAIVTSAIGAYYYLRLISYVLTPNKTTFNAIQIPFTRQITFTLSTILVLALTLGLEAYLLEQITSLSTSL